MNKLFKTLPFALGLLTLVSCSEDVEFTAEQAAKEYDGLIVKVAELTDGSSMRAAFVENGPVTSRAVAWKKGDQVKVYGMYNWRTQLYDYDADATTEFTKRTNAEPFAAFKLNKEESREKDQDLRENGVGYALYPSKLGYFDDEDRTKMVFELDDEFDYSVAGVDDYTELANIYEDAKAYSCPIPMWGYANGNQLAFEYLTGFIRVSLEGMEATEDNKLVVVASKPLNGTFEATAFNYDGDKQVPELAAVVGDDWTESAFDEDFELEEYAEENPTHIITVNIPKTVSGDNAIYVPIPAGDYKSLQVIYAGEPLKWKDNSYTQENVTDEKVTILRAKFLTAEYKSATDGTLDLNDVEKNNEMLTSIHDLIAEYGTKGNREQVVTITNTGNTTVAVGAEGTHLPELYTLDLSDITLTNDIKLLIDEKVSFTALENNAAAALKIVGAKGNKTVTIKFGGKLEVPVTLTEGVNNIVLIGSENSSAKAIEITTTGTLTIGGNFSDDVTVEAASVTVEATELEEEKELTITANTVDVEGAVTGDIVAEGATVNVKAAVKGNVTANIANVTTSETATASIEGTLNVTASANITNAKVTNIKTTTGIVTINNLEGNEKLEMEIESISLFGTATVNLNNGFVKAINNETEAQEPIATTVTITTKGKSGIGSVKNVDKATIKSYWDGNVYEGFKADGTYKDYFANGTGTAQDIYTASQLVKGNNGRTWNLLADIYLNETTTGTNRWNGLSRSKNNLNGNGHTIYNVLLAEDAKGFINTISQGGINNLTIDGFKATGTLNGVGTLVGNVNASEYTINISGVTVKNATIEGDEESYNLGGLIGTVTAGTVNVKNTTAGTAIKGYYNLGGIIGSIAEDASVTFGDGTSKDGQQVQTGSGFSIEVVGIDANNDTDEHAGKVAVLVGELNGTLDVKWFVSGVAWANIIDQVNWYYEKCQTTVGGNYYKFKGCKTGTNTYRYLIGYSPAENASFSYCGKEMKNALNESNTVYLYNVFER